MKEKAQAHQDWLPQAWATREALPKGKQWVIGELFRVFIGHLAGESKAVRINSLDNSLEMAYKDPWGHENRITLAPNEIIVTVAWGPHYWDEWRLDLQKRSIRYTGSALSIKPRRLPDWAKPLEKLDFKREEEVKEA